MGYGPQAFELIVGERINFAITRMVRLLAVSRSGCDALIDRKLSDRALRLEVIEQKVSWFHGDSDEVYAAIGSPPICARAGRQFPARRSLRLWDACAWSASARRDGKLRSLGRCSIQPSDHAFDDGFDGLGHVDRFRVK